MELTYIILLDYLYILIQCSTTLIRNPFPIVLINFSLYYRFFLHEEMQDNKHGQVLGLINSQFHPMLTHGFHCYYYHFSQFLG